MNPGFITPCLIPLPAFAQSRHHTIVKATPIGLRLTTQVCDFETPRNNQVRTCAVSNHRLRFRTYHTSLQKGYQLSTQKKTPPISFLSFSNRENLPRRQHQPLQHLGQQLPRESQRLEPDVLVGGCFVLLEELLTPRFQRQPLERVPFFGSVFQ